MFFKLLLRIATVIGIVLVAEPGMADRARDFGIDFGDIRVGQHNAITDVPGVLVGHVTVIEGDDIRTGVTAIVPHNQNIFQKKVPAAIYTANGFGKLAGYTQVEELGNLETPIILTNTLSVPAAADALIDYTFTFKENKSVRSVNPVVGETNDGRLNHIQARYLNKSHVLEAIERASKGPVQEGNVGAGTGTICFGYKGGIGTASRMLSEQLGGYILGVLVQTNFGGELTVAGVRLEKASDDTKPTTGSGDGSVMIVVATNAPLKARNLKRLARRALFGIARTGGNCSNGSGEYVIVFSTAEDLRSSHYVGSVLLESSKELRNDRMTPLFEAVADATEEAVINSLFAAEAMVGHNNLSVEAVPVDRVIEALRSQGRIR